MDVPAPEKQILLKVQFASVDRSKAKQLGINLFSLGLGNTIGGITTDNARGLIEAGADCVAVISALFGARDVRAAAQEFASLFDAARS